MNAHLRLPRLRPLRRRVIGPALAALLAGAQVLSSAASVAPVGAALPSAPAGPPAQESRVEVTVVGVERLEHSTQLVVQVRNTTDTGMSFLGLSDPAYRRAEEVAANDLSGIHLLDEAGNVEYLPYRDIEQQACICSSSRARLEAGDTWTLWWRSAALPDSVETVAVLGPDGEVLATGVEVDG